MSDSVFPRIPAHVLVINGNDRSLSEHLHSRRELCSLCFPLLDLGGYDLSVFKKSESD